MRKNDRKDTIYRDLVSRRIDFGRSVRQRPAPIDYVVPGLALGSFGLCVSPGGIGKSMFWLQASASIAAGADLFKLWSAPDHPVTVKQGTVIMVCAEDPTLTIEHRIHALGQTLSPEDCAAIDERLFLFPTQGSRISLVEEGSAGWDGSAWLAALIAFIEQMEEKPRLVIFDTLNRCLGNANENAAADMGAVVATLESLCARFGCSVLALHHANRASAKSDAVHTTLSSRGSSALTDNARFMLTLTSEDDRHVLVSFPKTSYCQRPASRMLRRDDNGVLWGSHADTRAIPEPEVLLIEDLSDEEGWK